MTALPGLEHPETMIRGAEISACGRYRYTLTRRWAEGPHVCWIMLNPSTADGLTDDATTLKCVKYSQRDGYGALVLVNLFAWRARDPDELKRVDWPVGDDNDSAVLYQAACADLVVAAWGANRFARPRAMRVRGELRASGIDVHRLGPANADGSPSHPLYLPDALPFEVHS